VIRWPIPLDFCRIQFDCSIGCGGKPADDTKNRVTNSSLSEYPDFAVRLREFTKIPRSTDEHFNRAALDLFAFQFAHNEPYRRLCAARNTFPKDVRHWTRIPAAPASAFKEFEMTCLPPEQRTAFFYSSGTTGQVRSRHFHNAKSLAVYETSLLPWFQAHIGPQKRPFIMLTPALAEAPNSSLVHMFDVVQKNFGAANSAFTGYADADGAWHVDLEKTVRVLEQAISAGQPVLLLGTAFTFVHLLDHLVESKVQLALPPESGAMETGGYKGRSRSLSRQELHTLISTQLGLPPRYIIREYGMSELSSQAYDHVMGAPDDTERRFQFPPWARVQIISPETGNEVAEGETGLIRIFDLANVYSVMAIQTEDLGIRRGDGFELLGRAVAAEPRGCSLQSL
jgi:hypothetical protein